VSQYTVYGMSASGNCYKVRLLLEQLQLSYQWIEVPLTGGFTRTQEFLAKNPNGRVPLLEIEPGQYLAESDAILFYLAEGSPLWPQHKRARAQVLQWMFFEQYSHEPYIAVARFICAALPAGDARRSELPRLRERGAQALAIMEQHLQQRQFFVADSYSIADIALYAYTHVASDGGFELAPYAAIRAWFKRVESQPRYLPMPSLAPR
jgi:glutathione S-transferase